MSLAGVMSKAQTSVSQPMPTHHIQSPLQDYTVGKTTPSITLNSGTSPTLCLSISRVFRGWYWILSCGEEGKCSGQITPEYLSRVKEPLWCYYDEKWHCSCRIGGMVQRSGSSLLLPSVNPWPPVRPSARP
jgi:hypothetical protein